MLEATLIEAAYPLPDPRHYPNPRQIQLQAKPAVGESLQEGYQQLKVTHVAHRLENGQLVIYATRE